jgi:hypothetical protein
MDPAVIEMAKSQAAARGLTTSTWVARLIRDATVAEASRRYDEYNRSASDASALARWDAAAAKDDDERLAGAEW